MNITHILLVVTLSYTINASISGRILSENFFSAMKSSGVFITFPILSEETENALLNCFNDIFTNSQWLDCVLENGEDQCDCYMYQQASTKCIQEIGDKEFEKIFKELTADTCQFEQSNKILDYEESTDLTILSIKPKMEKKGYFDFCCKEFTSCYEDQEDKFMECLNDKEKSVKECKCKFGTRLKKKCKQYCLQGKDKGINVADKFDKVIEQLCKVIVIPKKSKSEELMKRFYDSIGQEADPGMFNNVEGVDQVLEFLVNN